MPNSAGSMSNEHRVYTRNASLVSVLRADEVALGLPMFRKPTRTLNDTEQDQGY